MPVPLTVLVLKVGETTNPPGLLAANVQTIAFLYAGLDARVSQLGPGYSLAALYTERDLILIAMGACRANVQNSTDRSASMDQQESARLQAMYVNVQAEIVRVEDLARRSRAPQVGQLTTVQPLPNPFGAGFSPDASDPALGGSPYYPYPGGLNAPPVIVTNP
jgi:hypothetical protein